MKAPLEWLKQFVDIKEPGAVLSERLLMTGTEVEHLGSDFIEIKVLPNRGDCQSILGLARELSAIFSRPLKKQPKTVIKESAKTIGSAVKISVQDFEACPRYCARVIENVTIGPSPKWLQDRLIAAGLRPINNVVDVTNYLLLETGQPMHAFDLDRLNGRQIIVRSAASGEKLTVLDGSALTLKPNHLVIADQSRAVALAGVMGGGNSEVTSATKNIMLESAFFKPAQIHHAARELKLRTDASTRYEKGVAWDQVLTTMEKGAALIAELGGGTICKGHIDLKKRNWLPQKLVLSVVEANSILGTAIAPAAMAKLLKRLGFGAIVTGKKIKVTVPFWRSFDVYRPIDLVEEIARLWGYEKIKATLPNTLFENLTDERGESVRDAARRSLAAKGLNEVVTYSLIDPKDLEKINLPEESILRAPIRLANPLTSEQSVMRSSLIPSLLNVLKFNLNHQVPDVAIFELSKIFYGVPPKHHNEKETLSGVLCGNSLSGKLSNRGQEPATFFHLKGIVEDLLESLGYKQVEVLPMPHYLFHPGISAVIRVMGHEVGNLGRLAPVVEKNYDVKSPVFAFEIDLEAIFALVPPLPAYKSLPKFPSVERDLAILVDVGITNSVISAQIQKLGGALVRSVVPFDLFQGEKLGEKKSLAYRIIYQDPDKTLTDEVVNASQQRIIAGLQAHFGAQIR